MCYTFPLRKKYEEIWERGKKAILTNTITKDLILQDVATDKRLGLSINIPLQEPVLTNVLIFLEKIRGIEPDQFFYTSKSLHITVYDPIPSQEDFRLEPGLIKKYQAILDQELQRQKPIVFALKGITASPGAILIQGFCNDELQQLRTRIRDHILHKKIPTKERVFLDIAHCTAVRFINKVHNPQRLIQFIEENRNTEFGAFHANKVHYLISDWYSLPEKKKIVKEYLLQ